MITSKISTYVKPAEPTWSGRMSLSEWDMIGAITHVPTVYFYEAPHSDVWVQNDSAVMNHLRDSLAQTLVHFYPLAGRLEPVGSGRFELDCNAKGVRFVVAEAERVSLEDLGDDLSSPSVDLQQLIAEVDYTLPISEWPLLVVQLTKFRCGGISLGFNISHAVVDGLSALHFFNEWARMARGKPIGTVPFLDRKILRAGEPPLTKHPKFDPAEFQRPPVLLPDAGSSNNKDYKTKVEKLKLTKTKVQMLKDMVNEGKGTLTFDRPYTTYETLTAHIWKCACKARKLKPDQQTAVGVCVDSRRRLNPSLPDAYFGNAILDVKAMAYSGDLVTRSLGYAAQKIRKAVEKVDNYLKNQPDLTEFQDFHEEEEEDGVDHDGGPFFGMPNLGVINWLRLPILGLDFGFGKEVYMGSTHEFDGDTMLIQSQDGDGSIVLAICLRADHMDAFKRCFYDDIM
ncbi:Spermidine hydroxycinnamoyl transferase [Linum grandiflorum]